MHKPIDTAILARAVALADKVGAEDAAKACGISLRSVYRALKKREGEVVTAPSSAKSSPAKSSKKKVAVEEIVDGEDELLANLPQSADMITVVRALAANAWKSVAKLPPTSSKINATRTAAGTLAKIVAMLEEKRAGAETPEEAAVRKRREDAETLKRIEVYVREHEREAAARGVCEKCGQAVKP